MRNKTEIQIGDRVQIRTDLGARLLYWQGNMGTLIEVGPWFNGTIPRTITMKLDTPHSGMRQIIVQPSDVTFLEN